MGRPATGTKKLLADGQVRAEFVKRPGAPDRWRYTFANEAAADRWLTSCREAWKAGLETPDPRQQAGAKRPARSRIADIPPHLRTIERAARLWEWEYYEQLRSGGPERRRAARGHIDNHIRPYLEQANVVFVQDIDRQTLVEFATHLAGQHLSAAVATDSDPLDGVLVTRQQLLTKAAKSRSTVQRALGSAVPAVSHRDDGTPLYSLGAARRAGLLGSEAPRGGLDKEHASDILATLKRLLGWAYGHGWINRAVHDGISSIRPDAAVALKRKGKKRRTERPPIPLEVCAEAAQQLEFIDAVTMWIQRLLGLRLHESFGPLVGDLVDLGDYGILPITAQGGRRFEIRDEHGRVITVDRKEQLKNAESVRVVVVPRALMQLLRILIETYHTDEHGTVDRSARLVPGRRHRNAAGAQSYATNLKKAFSAVGDPVAGTDRMTSHDLRASLATDLRWSPEDLNEFAQKRFLGHGGQDVHDRYYVLNHPSMAPQLRIAEAIDDEVSEHLGHLRLASKPTKWNRAHAFYEQRHDIDEALRSYGVLHPEEVMTTGQLAEHFEVGQTTVRRWLRDGKVAGAVKIEGDGPVHYQVAPEAVEAHLAAPQFAGRPLDDVAAELGLTYHQARLLLHQLGHEGQRRPDGKYDLSEPVVAAMRREQERVRALHQRAVKHIEAAQRLGCSRRSISDRIARGELEVDPETDSSRAQFVTLASIERQRAVRAQLPCHSDEWVALPVAIAVTGLERSALLTLVRSGHLEQQPGRTAVAFSQASLIRWATGFRPDLLPRLERPLLRSVESSAH
jgi:integrase/transposase